MNSIAAKSNTGKVFFLIILAILGLYFMSKIKIHVGDWRDPQKICRTCNGTGYIKGYECFVCKGSGKAR